jgi:hypothetical protein
VSQLSQALPAYHDGQDSGKLHALETEPVKLGGPQGGKQVRLNYFNNDDQLVSVTKHTDGFLVLVMYNKTAKIIAEFLDFALFKKKKNTHC